MNHAEYLVGLSKIQVLGFSLLQATVPILTIIPFFIIKKTSKRANGIRWALLPVGFIALQTFKQSGFTEEGLARFLAGGMPIVFVLYLIGYFTFRDNKVSNDDFDDNNSKKTYSNEALDNHIIHSDIGQKVDKKIRLQEIEREERERLHREINLQNISKQKDTDNRDQQRVYENLDEGSVHQNIENVDTESFLKADAEFNSNSRNEGLWIKMLAVNDGDEKKAKANYIRSRAEYINSINEKDEN